MDAKQFERFVNHWCPAGWHHEPIEHRILRAFLAATACVEQLRQAAAGKKPAGPNFPTPTYPPGGTGLP